jgi:hypothetical protein
MDNVREGLRGRCIGGVESVEEGSGESADALIEDVLASGVLVRALSSAAAPAVFALAGSDEKRRG